MVHCFTSSEAELEKYIDLGFFIGITGFIMNTGKEPNDLVRSLLPKIPRNRLLLETDAPYMGFKGCRKGLKKPSKRYPNVPSALPILGESVAETLGMSNAELAELTTKNAVIFFGMDIRK